MNLKEWLNEAGVSVNAAAKAADMSQATLNAQANGSVKLKLETVIHLARRLNRNPVTALVETEFISPEEAAGVSIEEVRDQIRRDLEQRELESLSDTELTAEVRRLVAELDRRLAASEGRERWPTR